LDHSDAAGIVGNLPGPRGPKPTAEPIRAVYWDLHKERLQPLYQASAFLSGPRRISDWNRFVANTWAEESVEIQQAVKDERDKRHSIALDKWNMSASQPLDVETQRR
jgi:hypothetical protein